jgi:hypothetical protein
MTAITNGRQAAETPEALSPVRLLREAMLLIRGASPAILYLWVGVATIMVLAQFSTSLISLKTASPQFSSGYLGYRFAVIVFSGVANGLLLRLLFEGRAARLRFDRLLFECAGLLMLGQFAVSTIVLSIMGSVDPAEDPTGAGLRMVGVGVAVLVLYYFLAKLALWPLARLEGRDLSLGQAWRLMRRTVRSLVGAWTLAAIPIMGPMYAGYAIFHVDPFNPTPAYTVFATVLSSTFGLVTQGVLVAIYRRRVGETRDVAAVFD